MDPSNVIRGTGCGITAARSPFSRQAAKTRCTRLEQNRFSRSSASFFATPEFTTPAESRKEDTMIRKLADSGKLKIRSMLTPEMAVKTRSSATETSVRSTSSVAQSAMPRRITPKSRFWEGARASGFHRTKSRGIPAHTPALICFVFIQRLYHFFGKNSRMGRGSPFYWTGNMIESEKRKKIGRRRGYVQTIESPLCIRIPFIVFIIISIHWEKPDNINLYKNG